MTANQIKYWELRWRQYYEFYSLEETKRSNRAKEAETARSNLAKEAETKRHNLAEERIAKQELVIKRIQLSQSQEKIQQEWANLDRQERALFINTTLENYKLAQRDRELNISERNLALRAKEVQLQADKLLSDVTISIADLVNQYSQDSAKRDIERFNAYVNALDKGWTKAAAAKAISELERDDKTPESLKSLLSDLGKKYNLDVEINGPSTVGNKASDWIQKQIDKNTNDPHPYSNKDGTTKHDPTGKRELVEKYGPAYQSSIGKGGKVSLSGGGVTISGESGPGSNVSTNIDNNNNSKSTGSGIIYSGGTKVGPGWR